MENLPQHIENQFFKFLNKEMSIEEFEQWVYATDELETVLSADMYQELIAFNYQSRYVLATLFPILMQCLDINKFETYRIVYLLNLVINKDILWKKAVRTLYIYSREKYDFLSHFCSLDDYIEYYEFNQEELRNIQIAAIKEAIEIKNALVSNEIIIENGNEGGTNFIDYLAKDEK